MLLFPLRTLQSIASGWPVLSTVTKQSLGIKIAEPPGLCSLLAKFPIIILWFAAPILSVSAGCRRTSLIVYITFLLQSSFIMFIISVNLSTLPFEFTPVILENALSIVLGVLGVELRHVALSSGVDFLCRTFLARGVLSRLPYSWFQLFDIRFPY